MIDWLNVLFNFIWIFGLALSLALVSLAHWQAEERQMTFRQCLSRPFIRLAMALSFMLVALGLSLVVDPWWYKLGWVALLLLTIWEGITAWRSRSAQTKEPE